ncbi:MAG: type II 3-dehydroquinate dehydratase [Chitinophagaceae bacterium]
MNKILLIHGPNLNLLGSRQTEVYGTQTSEDIVKHLNSLSEVVKVDYFQSNSESELVATIQQSKGVYAGLIINAGAYSHTSVAIADALRSVSLPSIVVHISNIYQRESFRHADLVGDACQGAIVGLGIAGYEIAFGHLTEELI